IRTRFGAPRFAGTAGHLAYVRLVFVGREAVERLGDGIEAHERVGGPVGEPHLVLVVDVHRVRVRDAGQLPFAPGAAHRVVHSYLPRVPVAHPHTPFGIGPDAA